VKKIIFFISLIASLVLLINIISIITNDLDRLTPYGFGYLSGKIILFILFVSVSYFTRKAILINKTNN